MKIEHEVAILHYGTGQTNKGKTWHMIQVQDEDGYKFSLFGDKAKEYKDVPYGEIRKINMEIKAYFDTESKSTKYILNII